MLSQGGDRYGGRLITELEVVVVAVMQLMYWRGRIMEQACVEF
jgi:hypothetical protein